MAIEPVRGCGYRKVGGMYLCGSFISVPCDRLPLPLETCPTCGGGIKVSRGFTKINPYRLWGLHGYSDQDGKSGIYIQRCSDRYRPCHICDPRDESAFIMGVGEKFYKTPEDFMQEASKMGVSKRIPFIPKELKLGETILYLAHPRACEVREPVALQQAMAIVEEAQTMKPRLLETERIEKRLGIFTAFIPQRIEKLIWESDLTNEKREDLEKRGITPIPVPDGDKDHG